MLSSTLPNFTFSSLSPFIFLFSSFFPLFANGILFACHTACIQRCLTSTLLCKINHRICVGDLCFPRNNKLDIATRLKRFLLWLSLSSVMSTDRPTLSQTAVATYLPTCNFLDNNDHIQECKGYLFLLVNTLKSVLILWLKLTISYFRTQLTIESFSPRAQNKC